ncbi:MFS transporter [Streptomyces noursei]|uniref:MFS transporter n=1 Tax=Streptomyces noursei TaxID=1971 RepID=UPI0030F03115
MSRIPEPARPSARDPQRALPTPPSPDRRRWAALAVLLLGAFMGFLDIFIVNVAAPAIQTEWHAPFADVQLVPAGYTLAYAAGLVTGGRLGDAFGRRRVFLYGVGAFAVTSAGCALATAPAFLIGARLLQGLAASAMLPQVLALIQVAFPQDRARARALGLYGAVIGAGVLAGQILGGLLIAWDIAGLGWRTVFLVNVPLCAVTFVGAALLVGEDRTAVAGRLDLGGASLLGLGLFGVVHALVTGPERGWTAVPSCELATGTALLGLFLAWERRVERAGRTPLLPPRLLAQHGFSRGLPTVVCSYGANGAFVFLLAFHLQHALGFSPLGSALEFVPMAVLTSVGSALCRRMVACLGRWAVPAAAALTAVGLLAVGVAVETAAPGDQAVALLPGLLLYGFGGGIVATSLIGLTLDGVAAADAGAASGGILTAVQAAEAAGVAGVGALFARLAATGGAVRGFSASVLVLAGLSALTAVLLCFLPARRPAP